MAIFGERSVPRSVALAGVLALLRAIAAAAQGDAWLPLEPMREPRRLLAAAAEGGKIYTFGGCGSPCFEPPHHTSTFEETRVEVYAPPPANRWEVKRPMTAILFGATAAAPGNGRIYTFGGRVTPSLVQEYNPAADSWAKRKPMPTARHGHAAVAFGGKVYVLGGSALGATVEVPTRALEIYDPAANSWRTGLPMPTARAFLAAAEAGGKIYAIGGALDAAGESRTNVVEVYDPVDDDWTTAEPLPIALQTSAAQGVNGKVYVLGGFIPGSGVVDTVFEYDPATNRWTTERRPMPTPRDQAPAVLLDGLVYVLGGSVNCHCSPLAQNERYEPPSPPRAVLTCTKAGPPSVEAGGIVTYTIRVQNDGSGTATGVKLADPTPSGLASVGAACTDSPCSLGGILPGRSKSVEVSFQAPACPTVNPVENVATVSADGVEPIECIPRPKTAIDVKPRVTCDQSGPQSAEAGQEVTYLVTVSNPGCRKVRRVELSDPTPAGLTFVDVVSPLCATLPCRLGTIDPDESLGPVPVTFRVIEGCRDEDVSNVATVTGTNADAEACTFDTVLIPDLEVKVDAPEEIPGSEEFLLTVTVRNNGPPRASGVKLDVAVMGADSVTGIPDECETDAGDPGHFTCTLESVRCGAPEPPKLVFRVRSPACLACAKPGPITSTATLTAADADASNNHDSAGTDVTCPLIHDLAIIKEVDPDPVGPGDVLEYTITVRNLGCGDVGAVTVTDVFPPELINVRWCQGALCEPDQAGDLEEILHLAAGDVITYRARGTVGMLCAGTIHNTAAVAGPPGFIDTNPANNSSSVDTLISGDGVKAFCKDISGSNVEGGMISYTFVLLNCGPAVQMDNPGDEFTDTLPAGLTLTAVGASSGIPSSAGNTAMWNGSIPVGGMVTIDISATIDAGTGGTTLCNQAEIAFDADGNGTNESSGVSDDPDMPGLDDACCFLVLFDIAIPAVSAAGLAALACLLAVLALLRLRRRFP